MKRENIQETATRLWERGPSSWPSELKGKGFENIFTGKGINKDFGGSGESSGGSIPHVAPDPPWDPSITDGRRRYSQEWCRRKGKLPDGDKGFKGEDHNKGFERKGDMQREKGKGCPSMRMQLYTSPIC